MYSFFGGDLKDRFQTRLSDISGKNGFEKLQKFNRNLARAIKTERRNFTFKERLESKNFISLPGERPDDYRNCFENALEQYLGAKLLYPKSNPKLLHIDEGERGVHASVLFHHKGSIYLADPCYGIFSPVMIEPGKITGDRGKKIEFKRISEVDDSHLEKTVRKLQGGDVELFLTGGGQMIERSYESYRPYNMFMKVVDGKIISELRFFEHGLTFNTATRRTTDIENAAWRMDCLAFKSDNWCELKGEKLLVSAKEAKMGEKLWLNVYQDVAGFEDNLLTDLVHFTRYHHFMVQFGKVNKADFRTVYFTNKKMLDEFTEETMRKKAKAPEVKYMLGMSQEFLRRHLDYYILPPFFLMDKKERQKVKKKEDQRKVTWKQVKDTARLTSPAFGNSYANASYAISIEEEKRLREYTIGVYNLITGKDVNF